MCIRDRNLDVHIIPDAGGKNAAYRAKKARRKSKSVFSVSDLLKNDALLILASCIGMLFRQLGVAAVSYTHLDVYKRQEHNKCVLSVNEDVIKGDIEIIKHTDQGQTKIETPEEGEMCIRDRR